METPRTPPSADRPASAADGIATALAAQRAYLVRFARRRLRDDALVEDVVQETLLAAWLGAEAFAHQASVRTWLTGILQRRIADSVRSARRRSTAAVPDDGADHDDAAANAADAAPDGAPGGAGAEAIDWIDPPRRLEGRQFLTDLTTCLEALPPAAAQLFALREIDGLSNAQAAAALGLDPRRSTVLMHRTLGRLRDGLARHGHARSAAGTVALAA